VYPVAVSSRSALTKALSLIKYSVKKIKKEEHFDAQVVAAVEAKLREFHVDDPPSSAAEAT
jgi:hypothetical protein